MKVGLLATEVGSRGGVQRYGSLVRTAIMEGGHEVLLRETISWPTTRKRAFGLASLTKSLRGFDVLWVLHPRLALAGAVVASVNRSQLIVSTHGFETWGSYSRVQRWVMDRASVVTAVSNFSKAMMGSPGRKAMLLPPTWGVEAPADSWLPPVERRLVLFVGRLNSSYKGLDIVLSLARDSLRIHPEWRFAVSGTGPADSHLAPRVRQLPNTELRIDPSDAELANLYARAAVLLLPSRVERGSGNRWVGGEGFGIVILEASRHGVAVISSDEGACPEVVAALGSGLVTRPDAPSFGEALQLLMAEHTLRATLAARAVDRAHRHFSRAAFTERVTGVLQAAANGRRSQAPPTHSST